MKCLALIALAALAGAAATQPDPAGRYRLVGEQDVASELILTKDGRFAYMLAAGALDERAEGQWTRDGGTIHLITEPTPRPALFSAGAAARTKEAPLQLKVTWPDGRGIAGIDFRIGFDRGDPVEGYTQEYGWTLEPTEKRAPRWVELSLAMYGLVSPRFAIDTGVANDRVFVLTPNDLGIVDFRSLPLTIEGDSLLMHRSGATLTYRPIRD